MLEYDLTTRDLADRAGLPQKTISAMMNGEHNFRLDTLHKVCKALLIDEGTLMRPRVPMNVLMSRRLPRLTEKYCQLLPRPGTGRNVRRCHPQRQCRGSSHRVVADFYSGFLSEKSSQRVL